MCINKHHWYSLIFVFTILLGCIVPVCSFTDVSTSIVGVRYGTIGFGDYNSDGWPDSVAAGLINGIFVCRLYTNASGNFVQTNDLFTGIEYTSNVAWGDYDNDGDLDFAIAGYSSTGNISAIYKNNNGAFDNINAGINGVRYASMDWGDYDNDGDLDLLVAGYTDYARVTKVYRNNSGIFEDINATLPGVSVCSVEWVDYDNDSDLDIAITGLTSSGGITKIYRNVAGSFEDINANLVNLSYSSMAWGDIDNDGDLDLAISGSASPSFISKIYRNNNSTFVDIGANLTGVYRCSLAWGDYDNDGDIDLALAGSNAGMPISKIYRNDSGTFNDSGTSLMALESGSLSWVDYDNDSDLDLAICGMNESQTSTTKLYRNDVTLQNTPPNAPLGLSAVSSNGTATFSWAAASDSQTPAGGLSYNLRVGTTPGDDNVFCGMADIATGKRRIAAIGNTQKSRSWKINGLHKGIYYWSVQSIDSAYAGSNWASERAVGIDLDKLDIIAAKKLEDGEIFEIESVYVTAIFADCFYIEPVDRSSGIRVKKSGAFPAEGSQVKVIGAIKTDEVTGERFINAADVSVI